MDKLFDQQRSEIGKERFVMALEALKHLYSIMEEAKLELHSACNGCFEIRNFMNTPGYQGNREDPIGVNYFRPLSEHDFDYQQAVAAEKPLFANLLICVEIRLE